MKKIIIVIIAIILLNSCGIRFGDYDRYRQVNSIKTVRKVMIDGNKNTVHGVKNPGNWQAYQFTN